MTDGGSAFLPPDRPDRFPGQPAPQLLEADPLGGGLLVGGGDDGGEVAQILVDQVERLERCGVAVEEGGVGDQSVADLLDMAGGELHLLGDPEVDLPPGPGRPLGRRAEQAGPADGPKRRKWLASGNLYLRAGIKAVAHNISLDGNSYRSDDILVRRKPFVPEIGIGFELNVVGNFWLGYQFIHRGSEFQRRNGRDAPSHEVGSISLALKLDK